MYFWVKPQGWDKLKGRPPTRWKDGLRRSLYKIGIVRVKEVKKRRTTEQRKRGRPRLSYLASLTVLKTVVDWTSAEILAFDRDEWRMLTLKINDYEIEAHRTRLFATDGITTT
jgi:hypothetical protein